MPSSTFIFRELGRDDLADEMLRRIAELTGVTPTAAHWLQLGVDVHGHLGVHEPTGRIPTRTSNRLASSAIEMHVRRSVCGVPELPRDEHDDEIQQRSVPAGTPRR